MAAIIAVIITAKCSRDEGDRSEIPRGIQTCPHIYYMRNSRLKEKRELPYLHQNLGYLTLGESVS